MIWPDDVQRKISNILGAFKRLFVVTTMSLFACCCHLTCFMAVLLEPNIITKYGMVVVVNIWPDYEELEELLQSDLTSHVALLRPFC